MTREETKELLKEIQRLYPNFKAPDPTGTLDAWARVLNQYPLQSMVYALTRFALSDSSGFAPTIGQLVESIREAADETALTAMEAWSMAMKAARRATYYAEEEFDKLPKDVQRAVGSPTVLRGWASADIESLPAIQANFIRTYNARAKSERIAQSLPPGLRGAKGEAEHLLKFEDDARMLMIEEGADEDINA